MHIFVVDAGCDNMLNFNIAALGAPQYNTHRFGIYFADTPRHADLLIFLGPPVSALRDAVAATIAQVPEPFGILAVGGEPGTGAADPRWDMLDSGHVVGFLPGTPGPSDILGALLAVQRGRIPGAMDEKGAHI
jgi:Ni,Fe-hydrogenase III small subunit